ncbi:MAG: hypothetical protein IT464_12745 [Planctomycetes bacterium]|nr:hypothetical protein [Planctomycetota bacterium]
MTFANFQTQARYLIAMQASAQRGGQGWLHSFDSLGSSLTGLVETERARASAAVSRTQAEAANWNTRLRNALVPAMEYGCNAIGRASGTVEQMAHDLVEYMVAQGIYVQGRAVSYGANPADNVVGIHRRFTVNKWGQRIEQGNHELPDGITVRVRSSEADGRSGTGIRVRYEGSNAPASRNNSLRIKGAEFAVDTELVGPRSQGLAPNAVLQGNADVADGDAITTDGIAEWTQERTGTPVVRVKTSIKFGEQPYGVGVGGPSTALVLYQEYTNWDLDGSPIAEAIPVYMNGAAWEGDIVYDRGVYSEAWDETDLSNGAWVVLLTDVDENGYAPNFDDDDDIASLTITQGAFGGGGEEIVLGGIYVAKAFKLPTGEYHVCWENGSEPQIDDEVSFGADSQTQAGPLADGWAQAIPEGPSLPISGGGAEWTPLTAVIAVTQGGAAFADNDTEALGATGTTEQDVTFRITNSGYAPMAVQVPATSGSPTNCSLTTAGLTVPAVIEPGKYLDITLGVTPAGVGAYSILVHVVNSGGTTPFRINISGTAS